MKGEKKELKFTLNGKPVVMAVRPKTLLVDLLRKELRLTGTKVGCLDSACGACTVNIDGKAVRSCSVLALPVNGRKVVTIEGVADGEKLHPIQEAIVSHGAVECGFCVAGMIMSAKALLDRVRNPGETEIRAAMADNLCRCGTHTRILRAIQRAAKELA
jgi:aerobic-type carbon monoxide dehydrogenase small subunit (CoxS/CutS family)